VKVTKQGGKKELPERLQYPAPGGKKGSARLDASIPELEDLRGLGASRVSKSCRNLRRGVHPKSASKDYFE